MAVGLTTVTGVTGTLLEARRTAPSTSTGMKIYHGGGTMIYAPVPDGPSVKRRESTLLDNISSTFMLDINRYYELV